MQLNNAMKLRPPSSIIKSVVNRATTPLIFVGEVGNLSGGKSGKVKGGMGLWDADQINIVDIYNGNLVQKHFILHVWPLHRHNTINTGTKLGFHRHMTHVEQYQLLVISSTYSPPTLIDVGHQWTERSSIICYHGLSLAKTSRKLPPVDRNRSLVARTNMCGECITQHWRMEESPPPS